jgi:hypothetical protein
LVVHHERTKTRRFDNSVFCFLLPGARLSFVMNPPKDARRGNNLPIKAATLALLFVALSWAAGSVGWIFSCSAAVVTAIVAGIFGVVGFSGGGARRSSAILGMLLAAGALVLLYFSYRHVAAAGRL